MVLWGENGLNHIVSHRGEGGTDGPDTRAIRMPGASRETFVLPSQLERIEFNVTI